jgi:hypothetical protein
MKQHATVFSVLVLIGGLLLSAHGGRAQTATIASTADTRVPRLVRFIGMAKDSSGSPLAGTIGITFTLCVEQTGGTPLWLETQNVQPDRDGRYSVLLGATKPEGLPAELFTSEQAHWVGVQVSGQAEQPRFLLVSAPYALKAGDAETVGGLPPSAFMLAAPASGATSATSARSATSSSPPTALQVTTAGGTVNAVPLWDSNSDITNSIINQSGSGTTAKIGINTSAPLATLDLHGSAAIRGTLSLPVTGNAIAAAGKNSQPLNMAASAFNSANSAAANQTFQWLAEPAGNDTSAPSATLNLLFGAGTAKPTETGLRIASDGQITFAAGQTFPGAGGSGTITSVTAGTGLTGGGTSGNVTLSLNMAATNALYAQLNAANTFTGNQTVNGVLTASSVNFGLQGIGTGTAAVGVGSFATGRSGIGVYADSQSTSGNGAGVLAHASSNESTGVVGVSPNIGVLGDSYASSKQGTGSGKAGVWGDSGGPSGSGYYGVLGTADANSAGGFFNNGIYPTLVAKNNAGAAVGVIAVEGQSSNIGVYGVSSGGSGLTGDNSGVWGDTGGPNNENYAGVLGTANENVAGWFVNDSSGSETLFVENNAASSASANIILTDGANFGGRCMIDVSGTITCNGKVVNVVGVDGGARRVALYSMQSPENWFEDFGSGALSNGAATVTLDPTFAQTVNTGAEYHIFLTPNGDSKGLYVSQKTANSFEVREQGSGTSSVAFDYRIVARRMGYENLRLEDLTERFNQGEARHKKMQLRMGPSAAPSSTGPVRVTKSAPFK